jgi:hypothetical protein
MSHPIWKIGLFTKLSKDNYGNYEITEIIGHCKRIVGHFKHSNKAAFELKLIQEIEDLPVHSLIQVLVHIYVLIIEGQISKPKMREC